MLTLSKSQFDTLDEKAERGFRETLRTYLEDRHPGFLPRFPEESRKTVVANMLERARAAGATWQSSIALLCDLMELFAPNLFGNPAVAAIVGTPDEGSDARIKTIPTLVTEDDWQRVIRNRSDLGFYTAAAFDAKPLEARVAQALPVVLWDHVTPETAPQAAAKAIEAAAALDWDAHEDAALAVAAWRFLYGPGFATAEDAWAQDVRSPSRPAEERLRMLRARIMLDHQRRV